ncbi:MAG: hypothetical protein K8S87_09285 [Planctomycetes bacterium]|nr:hypothetical protein [Planctomycetota bacterium]
MKISRFFLLLIAVCIILLSSCDVLLGGKVMLDANGRKHYVKGLEITVVNSALVRSFELTVSKVDVPSDIPRDITAIGQAYEIKAERSDWLNMPLIIEMDYDDELVRDEDNIIVFIKPENESCKPATVLEINKYGNEITFETRVFGEFFVAELPTSPAFYSVPNFAENNNGWDIANFGFFPAVWGNCLGMSALCKWFFENMPQDDLWGYFPSTNYPSIEEIVINRAHLAQSQYYAHKDREYQQEIGEVETGKLLKSILFQTKQPQIFLMANIAPNGDFEAGHACVVYGYDNNLFRFYDVNHPGVQQTVSFDNLNGFGLYDQFNLFGFVTQPSLGRSVDFAQLVTQAENGFSQSQYINVTSIDSGDSYLTNFCEIKGEVTGLMQNISTIYVMNYGVLNVGEVANGEFEFNVDLNPGMNLLVLLANEKIEEVSNWYYNCATLVISDIECYADPLDLRIFLENINIHCECDIYLTSPSPGSETCWYDNQSTTCGLTHYNCPAFYCDDQKILMSTNTGGIIKPGKYIVKVRVKEGWVYEKYCTVQIILYEGTPNQRFFMKNVYFTMDNENPGNDAPGSTGDDWFNIAEIDLVNAKINSLN